MRITGDGEIVLSWQQLYRQYPMACSLKFMFHVASTTSDEVRQMTGRTLACVLIQLEGWLDKTRVEIVALDCSGCGN